MWLKTFMHCRKCIFCKYYTHHNQIYSQGFRNTVWHGLLILSWFPGKLLNIHETFKYLGNYFLVEFFHKQAFNIDSLSQFWKAKSIFKYCTTANKKRHCTLATLGWVHVQMPAEARQLMCWNEWARYRNGAVGTMGPREWVFNSKGASAAQSC